MMAKKKVSVKMKPKAKVGVKKKTVAVTMKPKKVVKTNYKKK